MRIRCPHHPDDRRAMQRGRSAVTLIELLTVVAIIALLIAVLVPAIGTVRRSMRATTTRAALATLSAGLDGYRSEQRAGGEYPPSASDVVQTFGRTGLTYRMKNPYARPDAPPSLPNMPMTGAGLLYWALLGADGLGTPAFRPTRSGSLYWGADCGNASGEAYELDPATKRPVRERLGPYVEPGALRVSLLNRAMNVASDPDYNPPRGQQYEIAAETRAAKSLNRVPPARFYPLFLDAYGGPILYYRADATGVQAVDYSPNDAPAQGSGRGIYHFRDNSEFLDAGESPLILSPAGLGHPIALPDVSPNNPTPFYPNAENTYDLSNAALVAELPRRHPFAAYIRDARATTALNPQNASSFLLISAGPDGRYGTADDITNFEHHGGAVAAAGE